jgi:SAM-dependent methyltransferase
VDAVLLVTTLEFVSDIDVALAEAARVVKPGGRMVLGVLHARGPWARRRLRSKRGVWSTARLYHRAELEQLLEKYGQVRSRLLVHVPPQLAGAPRPVLAIMDGLLRIVMPSSGAFLAVRVDVGR